MSLAPEILDSRMRASPCASLAGAGLPTDGVEEHFHSFFVVDDGGRIVAAAGLELYGEHALLRSVVVADGARGTGLGSTLTRRTLDEARARGVGTVYLLTMTAGAFFPRFGFERAAREEIPEHVQASREFRGACPSTAVAMRLALKPRLIGWGSGRAEPSRERLPSLGHRFEQDFIRGSPTGSTVVWAQVGGGSRLGSVPAR
jgi:amino-acid N-acetyltransferase